MDTAQKSVLSLDRDVRTLSDSRRGKRHAFNKAAFKIVSHQFCPPGIKWYWARTHDMPAMIRYLDHWATAATPRFDGRIHGIPLEEYNVPSGYSTHPCTSNLTDVLDLQFCTPKHQQTRPSAGLSSFRALGMEDTHVPLALADPRRGSWVPAPIAQWIYPALTQPTETFRLNQGGRGSPVV
ncbi:hypothetical protein TNCV_1433121 [Trichonephila clavipes]|nr:hypothetical protein TNCV_1433121 [Trichonephila clavipes]